MRFFLFVVFFCISFHFIPCLSFPPSPKQRADHGYLRGRVALRVRQLAMTCMCSAISSRVIVDTAKGSEWAAMVAMLVEVEDGDVG